MLKHISYLLDMLLAICHQNCYKYEMCFSYLLDKYYLKFRQRKIIYTDVARQLQSGALNL